MTARQLAREEGWALVTAILVMAMMMMVGLAAFSFVDQEQKQSGIERVRESSFNLAESMLDSQALVLNQRWPATAPGFPSECASGGTDLRCAALAPLAQNISGPDFAPGTFTWATRVRDNGGASANFYSSATDTQTCVGPTGVPVIPATAPCTYDANGDNQVWVRSQAVVRGQRRTVVAKVTVDRYMEQFPRAVITAGSFKIQAGAPKQFVTTQSASGQVGPVIVRCGPLTNPVRKTTGCVDYKKDEQVYPPTIRSEPTAGPALSPDALQRIRVRAQAEGWYYPGCPASPPGPLVFVEAGSCNSNSLPPTSALTFGTYIQVSGSITISGDYWGLVYVANAPAGELGVKLGPPPVRTFHGAIAVDGAGAFEIQTGASQFIYDERAFSSLNSYGGSGVVRSSWRELGS